MKISDKIRQLRNKASMTQEQLAERLGISAQSVSKWENEISMPDITLLPDIAEIFGISIDELFDLTVQQKLRRIENRIEIEEELPEKTFKEYEEFLLGQLSEGRDRKTTLPLLASLYHHRMEFYGRKVNKYSKEAIFLDPAKKQCQWLLNMAEGHATWDWNMANHSIAIDFYKEVISIDKGEPKSSLPYYYLIDNLLADNRADEAERYLNIFKNLPSANPVLVDVYKAYIALAKYDVLSADAIIAKCVDSHPEDSGYLFEAAQYYARKCEYEKAVELYERSWKNQKAPRYTDALDAIATISKIVGNKKRAAEAYDRILECLKADWGYSDDDMPCVNVAREKSKILQ